MTTYFDLDWYLRQQGVEHFTAREIAPRKVPPRPFWGCILPTLHVAERLRATLPQGVIHVTSGYRDPDHNKEVGGARESLHVNFNALDIKPYSRGEPLLTAHVVDHLLEDPIAKHLSIGRYRTFVHIDTRALIHNAAPWRAL